MLYLDFESLFERFCIQTTMGGMSDAEPFAYLQKYTTPTLYKQLVDKVMDLEIG